MVYLVITKYSIIMEEQGAFKEVQFHDEFRKEIIDKLLELHRQLVLLEYLEKGSECQF